jgi:ATPase subunit of ABC transporter with duplicated ATPase domains
LDVTTIKVLNEALHNFEGTVIVISHDRGFLDDFQPTHVMTVRDGSVKLEERGLKEEDWNDILGSREASKFASNNKVNDKASKSTPAKKGSSSKQISKLESSIAKMESEIKKLDEELIENAKNFNKVKMLNSQRAKQSEQLEKLYAEYELLVN